MFQKIELVYILLPLFAAIVIFSIFTRNRFPVATGLKYRTIIFGIILIVLLFALPVTPSLSTFGYPGTIEDISSPEKTLKYLQQYNDAIVRTTEVLHCMIFTLVFWFLATILDVIKLIDSKKDKKASQN